MFSVLFDQDLNFFADNMWKLGMNVTAGKFLFLGDYVDRGMQGLECLAYLFSLKVGWPCSGYHSLRLSPLRTRTSPWPPFLDGVDFLVRKYRHLTDDSIYGGKDFIE